MTPVAREVIRRSSGAPGVTAVSAHGTSEEPRLRAQGVELGLARLRSEAPT